MNALVSTLTGVSGLMPMVTVISSTLLGLTSILRTCPTGTPLSVTVEPGWSPVTLCS